MSVKPMSQTPGDHPAAGRLFVGREEFVAPVQSALREPQRTRPLVLVYYGGAGIGKSRLRLELAKQFVHDPHVAAATLDFDIPAYRQPDAALLFLRNALHQTYQARFPSFDVAYAILWQKTHPDTPLGSEEGGERREEGQEPESYHKDTKAQSRTDESGMQTLLASGSLLSQLLDESGKLPLIGLIPRISALVDSRQDTAERKWRTERGERELEDLPQMEPSRIPDVLPKIWSADVRDFLGAPSRKPQASSNEGQKPEGKSQEPRTRSGQSGISQVQNDGRSTRNDERGTRQAVLLIDSYEKLWEIGSAEADFFKRDEWVRELARQLPEVLWIVCGRQKLRWEEVDKEWGASLSQHELGALPRESVRRFLNSCGITNEPIQDAIVKGSQGVPHYLDLAVDTMRSAECRLQDADFEGGSPAELQKQFIRHLNQPEIEALQVLSAPRFWYYGLFENLMTEYQTGYPLTAYDDLSRFSFVSEGAAPGTQTMHELMREALQEEQSPELRKRVHQFLHEYYARQLDGLNVKGITELHRMAMAEAFYHARQVMAADELWAWVRDLVAVFDAAGQYRFVIPIYREVLRAHGSSR
jgi:hypothetical protein